MINMEQMDSAALGSLKELLSEENQTAVALALRSYKNSEKDRIEGFKAAVGSRIKAKQGEYDTIMHNISTVALPPEVLKDLGERLQAIKSEIAELENATPPEDYSVETIRSWLEAIKAAPDDKAVKLLISRIDTVQENEKTAFNIHSTLKTVLEKMAKVPQVGTKHSLTECLCGSISRNSYSVHRLSEHPRRFPRDCV